MNTLLGVRLALESVEERLTPARFGPEVGPRGLAAEMRPAFALPGNHGPQNADRSNDRDQDRSGPAAGDVSGPTAPAASGPVAGGSFGPFGPTLPGPGGGGWGGGERQGSRDDDDDGDDRAGPSVVVFGRGRDEFVRPNLPPFFAPPFELISEVREARENAQAPAAQQPVAARVVPPPAAQVRDADTSGPTARPNGITAALLGDSSAASPVPAQAGDPAPVPGAVQVAVAAATPPAANGNGGAWAVPFAGATTASLADAPPAEDAIVTDPPTAAEPTPGFVEKALDAILPYGVPVLGALPLAAEWIEQGANDFLTRLETLGEDVVGDLPAWEQAAWLAGAVLVLGGVTYTVRAHAPRRRPDAQAFRSRLSRLGLGVPT
jgi:hypothetical protein